MTRETKIGLLVGLAFIIVIGILLSDHLTSSTEPPPAPMSQAGPAVRSGISTPARGQQPTADVIAPPVQVDQPVPAAGDLVPRPQPVKIVQIDTPPQNEPVTIFSNDPARAQDAITYESPVTIAARPEAPAPDRATNKQQLTQQPAQSPSRPIDPVMARLNQEAQKVGEAIVPIGNPSSLVTTAARKYKAEPGDSLSKIATKMYGTSTRALRDAIVEANPSLKENPNLVIEGRTYTIPAVTAATNTTTNKPVASAPDPVAAASNATKSPTAPTSDGAVYTVEEGDNLTRIAIAQCGDAAAVAAIKELNRDQLNGTDLIRPGMKLKLPTKSVAVNN